MKQLVLSIFILILIQAPREAGAKYPLWRNIHAVKEGELYRSAQLRPHVLDELLKSKKIKTIINLRGHNPGQEWFDEEKKVADANGVKIISIGMSAKRLPHRKDLLKLIEAYHSADYPILVHCQAGADRTGEAAAMYLIDFYGVSKKQALKQLTLKYYHSGALKPAKRYFIKNVYEGQNWVEKNYFPCEQNWKHYDKQNFCN